MDRWQQVRQAVGRWIAGDASPFPPHASPATAQQSILPASFGGDPSMAGYRRFSGNNGQSALRDLPLPTHERAQQIAYFLYLTNPMAQWSVNIQTAYVVGEGASVLSSGDDEDVQAVLDAWWGDEQNDWDLKLDQKVRELGLYGEQCWPCFTAEGTGRVRLGYLDPFLIEEVVLSPDDAEQPIGVITKRYAIDGAEIPQRRLKVVTALSDEELGAAARRLRDRFADGECFYYAVNKVSNGSRGWSDLLARADWLDGYEQFMFQRLERADLGNRVVADIELQGMTPDQVAAYAKAFIAPKPGGHFFHNEKVKYTITSPDLHASDAAADARLFKHQAISGLPEHWYGGGGDVNRACHDMETETLTERGWLRYHEITDDDRIGTIHPDTGALEFHRPVRRYLYPYAGPMIRIRNKRLDLLVTPDHRMWVKRERNDPSTEAYEMLEAQKMVANRWHILVGGSWLGHEVQTFTLPEVATGCTRAVYPAVTLPMDHWLEFLGYWISEGHARAVPGEYTVSLTQKKSVGVAAIRACLAALPFEFRESEDDRGCIRWVVSDKGLNAWLREQCGGHQPDRYLPAFVHTLSARQLRILFDAMILGDGSVDPRDGRTGRCYYTSSPRLADEMQVLAFKLGMQAKVGIATRCYRVQINARTEALIGQDAIRYEDYRGEVYCFEVPNHLFVTRRHGKVAITHNTAGEMDEPTYKLFQQRQKIVKGIVQKTARHAVRQAKVWGMVPQSADERVTAVFPSMVQADLATIGSAMQSLSSALAGQVNAGTLTKAEARRTFATAVQRLGVDLKEMTDADLDAMAAEDRLRHDSQDYRHDPDAKKQTLTAKAAQAMKRIK